MIKANFNAYASYITDSLYQWDLNQVLSVSGLNLAVIPEVHFSNANMGRAIVRQATLVDHVVNVDIPNSLLQDPLTINAHIGVYEGETFKVIEVVSIPVIPKKRPEDYQIQDSDEEIYSFKALENKIDNALIEIQAVLSQYSATGINLDGKENEATIVASTMLAKNWSNGTYSFESTYPVGSYNIEISLNSTATLAQVKAFNSANIVGSATSNIVRAYGDVPTVDIPIIIKAVAV